MKYLVIKDMRSNGLKVDDVIELKEVKEIIFNETKFKMYIFNSSFGEVTLTESDVKLYLSTMGTEVKMLNKVITYYIDCECENGYIKMYNEELEEGQIIECENCGRQHTVIFKEDE